MAEMSDEAAREWANQLLLGVLAVQNQLISESALRAAVAECQSERNEDGRPKQPLVQILVERHGLASEMRAALEPLVGAHIKQHEGDPEKSLAALSSVSTLVRDLRRQVDPEGTHLWKAPAAGGSKSKRSRAIDSTIFSLDQRTLEDIDAVVDQFDAMWDAHQCPQLEAFLANWSQPHENALFHELLLTELHRLQKQQNREIAEQEYQQRFPQFESVVREVFRGRDRHFGSPRRFRILKEDHAHGGLGVVHLAQDRELGRNVALKEILPANVDSADAQQRFLREATITGGLEHPGIVPVYSLGQYDDGRPFYAMRLIKGDNLQYAIKQFHAPTREGEVPAEQPTTEKHAKPQATKNPGSTEASLSQSSFSASNLQFRELLGRFVDVCQAIAYAHSRGVLHRDLKPGNVMLGKYGETLVIDWGLAKVMQPSPETPANQGEGSVEPALHSATAQDHEQTVAGPQSVLGSPQYMSPEQASGKIDELGPATDVFSLGAILFELLTGQPPIGSDIPKDEEARLRQAGKLGDARLTRAKQGDFPSPRQLRPDVPAPLEAVCLKAMSFRSDARYESAQLLAEDIERWLADEPVAIWPEPITIRARRWMKKHQVAVATTAAAVLMAVIGLGVLVGVTSQHNIELTNANQKKDEQTQLAKKRADDLTKANDEITATLARSNFFLAVSRWEQGRVADASNLLDLIPEKHRHWEWHYSKRQFEGSDVTLHGHSLEVMCVAYSPDGRQLASGSRDKSIKLWNAVTGEELQTLIGHSDVVRSLSFSPDGKKLATASDDKTLKLWDVDRGEQLRTLTGHMREVTGVSFSPNGLLLASGSSDDAIKLWDADSGTELQTLLGHRSDVTSIVFSPDGHLIASSSKDKTVKLWDSNSGEELRTLSGHPDWVMSASFSPDGHQVAAGCADSTLKIWDIQNGENLQTSSDHTNALLSVSFSPDGERLAIAKFDGTIKVAGRHIDAKPLTLVGHTNAVGCVCFSPDGQRIASASGDQTIKVWDARTGAERRALTGHKIGVQSVCFSPDGKQFASANVQERIVLREATDFDQFASNNRDPLESAKIKLWDARTGDEIGTLNGYEDVTAGVTFSPDGRWLATADWNAVSLFDMQNGGDVRRLAGHAGRVLSVAFSSNSRYVASGGDDKTIKIWDVQSGEEARSMISPPFLCLVFSPDGHRLASACRDKTVRIWDALSGKEIRTLTGHADNVLSYCQMLWTR